MEPYHFSLLIDENLSPNLVKLAAVRGFRAAHVNSVNLRTAGDKAIARYAVERGMILVTSNVRDFRILYRSRKHHPGLIFLSSEPPFRLTQETEGTLFIRALEEILRSEPLQEAIAVKQLGPPVDPIEIELDRFELPPHD